MSQTILCQLPLSMENMKPFILDPSLSLAVDYHNSQLRDRALLIYCTNISIPGISIDLTGCSDAEQCQLIDAYITHKSTINIQNLTDIVVYLMLFFKGIVIPVQFQKLITTPSPSLVQHFFASPEYVDHLSKMMHVLDSIPLYLFTTNVAFTETYGEPSTVFPSIDDIHYTGYTFINVLNHPLFVTLYFTKHISADSQVYFKQQFKENLFEGKPLFHFFATQPNNHLLMLYNGLFGGTLSPEDVTAFNDFAVQELAKGTPNDIPV